MRAAAIITDVVVYLSPAEAERLKSELGAWTGGSGAAVAKLYDELAATLERAESSTEAA